MDIGLYIKWHKGSLTAHRNVLGDELIGEAMCKALRKVLGVTSAELYAPNNLPSRKLDIMIYLNDTPPRKAWAHKHVLYMQNAYGEGSHHTLKSFQKIGYDGYAFISNKLLDLHLRDGFNGIFLPFGVDLDTFYPRPKDERYKFEVAYIGNDIKGEERTMKYIFPAVHFQFGLFGNWNRSFRSKILFWEKRPPYQQRFQSLSRGKIPQEQVPMLYSSAKINLNCTAQDCVDWDTITLRTFEVLACRGFLITDRVKAAEESMPGCMVFTDGGEDLTQKIEYYLSNEKSRQQIANTGYEYVIRHASIDARMQELIAYLRSIV